MKVLRAVTNGIGRGLLAGLAGAVAMTISSTIEMKRRRRPPSSAPADAAGRVLGVQPRDEDGKRRFANAVHYAYGSGWGLARAAIGAAFCAARRQRRHRRASIVEPLAHFAAVWGASLIMLPALGIAKPFWRWGAKEVAIDALHHTVYVAATDGAYRLLGRT
jgi:hypothetical protein